MHKQAAGGIHIFPQVTGGYQGSLSGVLACMTEALFSAITLQLLTTDFFSPHEWLLADGHHPLCKPGALLTGS